VIGLGDGGESDEREECGEERADGWFHGRRIIATEPR
jgi:hypothetical protein